MVSLFTLPPGSFVLDPCFGGGVFLDSLLANARYATGGYEIDGGLFAAYARRECRASLYSADFLLGGGTPSLPGGTNGTNGIDGIIMNPPYIRHEKIDSLAEYGITKRRLRAEPLFAGLPKTANLYMYFVIKAIDMLRTGGELVAIFPGSWQNARCGAAFGALLESRCAAERKIHVGGRAFETDALVDAAVLKLKKGGTQRHCDASHASIEGDKISIRKAEKFARAAGEKVAFGEYAAIRRGLSTGFNRVFINPGANIEKRHLAEIISSPKRVKGYSTEGAATDSLLLVGDGDEMGPALKEYLDGWERRIAGQGSPKTLAEKIAQGKKWYALKNFDCKGIIFGYIVREDMRFILNSAGTLARDNFYVIYPKIDCHTMLALLNNHYAYAQLEALGRTYGKGELKLQKYDVEALELADLSRISGADARRLADLGRGLAESGDRKIIDETTALLSAYEAAGADEIKRQRGRMRAIRLGDANGQI